MTRMPPSRPLMSAATELLAKGVSFIPADRTRKQPHVAWKPYQQRCPTMAEALEWFNCEDCADTGPDAIAAICGLVSGGLECMDFDCEAAAYDAWAKRVGEYDGGLLERLVILQTQSGGKHVLYRCPSSVESNQPLAHHLVHADPTTGVAAYHGKTAKAGKRHGDRAAFVVIETRGEGGYVLTEPTYGYTLLQGKVADAPLITDAERSFLFACARFQDHAFQEDAKKPKAEQRISYARTPGDPMKPGEAFNRSPNAADMVVELLKGHGWTLHHTDAENHHMTRPGKATGEGTSATVRRMDGLLFNFSSNAPTFSAQGRGDRGETPFSVYAHLQHGGDYRQAALALARDGFGTLHAGTASTEHAPEQPAPAAEWDAATDANTAMDALQAMLRHRQGARTYGIAVPDMPMLSDRLGGFTGYTLLSGDTGTGKTVLATRIALSVAGLTLPTPDRQHASEEEAAAGTDVKVVYVAAELGRTEILTRMLGVLSCTHHAALRVGEAGVNERHGMLGLRLQKHRAESVDAGYKALHRLLASGHLTVLSSGDFGTAWHAGQHCMTQLQEACERVRGQHERMLVVMDSIDAIRVFQRGNGGAEYRDDLSADAAKVDALLQWREALGQTGALLLLQEESKAAAGSGSTHAGRGSGKYVYRSDGGIQVMSATALDAGRKPLGTVALGMREPVTPRGSPLLALDLIVNKARVSKLGKGTVGIVFEPLRERITETDSWSASDITAKRHEKRGEPSTEKSSTAKKAKRERIP